MMRSMCGINMPPLQGLGFVAMPLHRATPYVSAYHRAAPCYHRAAPCVGILCPFRASHEVATYANDGCSPSHLMTDNTLSHEVATYANDGCSPSHLRMDNTISHEEAIYANDGYRPSHKRKT